MMLLEWSQVQPFFEEHGCVVVGNPEMRWYEESWGALERADLTNDTIFAASDPGGMKLRLRAFCLVAMYLGMYEAAGEFRELGGFTSGPVLTWCLETLNVKMNEPWALARLMGSPDTESSHHWEDGDMTDDAKCEVALAIARGENSEIYQVLLEHYGSVTQLFASLWNSRLPEDQVEPWEELASSWPSDEQMKVFSYVEGGMSDWNCQFLA